MYSFKVLFNAHRDPRFQLVLDRSPRTPKKSANGNERPLKSLSRDQSTGKTNRSAASKGRSQRSQSRDDSSDKANRSGTLKGRSQSSEPFDKPARPNALDDPSRTVGLKDALSNQLIQNSLRRRTAIAINGENHELDSLILRDSCSCNRCIDPSTTQKRFNTTDIPRDIMASIVRVDQNGSFCVSWTKDVTGFKDHRSYFPSNFLLPRQTPHAVVADTQKKYPRILWECARLEAMKDSLTVKYDDYMSDDLTVHQVTRQLLQYGIAFISKVPTMPESVASIGNRFGPLKNTIYSPTWDVRPRSSAENVADTSSDLGLHMVSFNFLILCIDLATI